MGWVRREEERLIIVILPQASKRFRIETFGRIYRSHLYLFFPVQIAAATENHYSVHCGRGHYKLAIGP